MLNSQSISVFRPQASQPPVVGLTAHNWDYDTHTHYLRNFNQSHRLTMNLVIKQYDTMFNICNINQISKSIAISLHNSNSATTFPLLINDVPIIKIKELKT